MRKEDKDAILVATEILKRYCSRRCRCGTKAYGKKICPFLDIDNGQRCMLASMPSQYDTDKIAEAVSKF